MELHAVILRKPIKLSQAKKEASKIIDNQKKFFRETSTSFRFRNIPKTKFNPESFRTKVVNKDLSLVFGKLKKNI